MVSLHIELAKVAIRQDQPAKAVEVYNQGLKVHPYETHLVSGIARVHDLLNDSAKSVFFYKKVITLDNSSIESIASLASYHFYTD